MTWEHYEVWSVDEDGLEELVDTTGSLHGARQLAESTVLEVEGVVECVIYQENEDGELMEVEVIAGP